MVIRTFLDKCNTIVKDRDENFGIHPILMLHYGGLISRILLSFDIDKIKNEIGENYYDYKHTLKMFNCGSIDKKNFNETINGFCGSVERKRTSSFDVIAFEIPTSWDSGNGFDSIDEPPIVGDISVSFNGSNWYQASNGKLWENEGIYDTTFLSKEYTKYGNDEESIVISRQHFDYGNESMEIDITKYVNDVIEGKKSNNGICLAFSPLLEDTITEETHYVGFFGKHTNTCFHPCIESRNKKRINDNRDDFILGKENKLYLFTEDNGEYFDLDETPICTINDRNYEVSKVRKGCYCANVKISKNDVEPETILYDVWSNIKINNELLDDIEMEFITNSGDKFLNLGVKKNSGKEYEPHISGINDYEKLVRGDKRDMVVYFREKYTASNYRVFNNAEYRLYIKDGDRELDIISWDVVEKMSSLNIFNIDTNGLVPNTYYIDIRFKNNSEVKTFKKTLVFEVLNNTSHNKR